MLLSYAELEMDEPTFRKGCYKSLESSSPAPASFSAPASSSSHCRPSSPEHQLAESLIAGIIQPHLSIHSPGPCSPHALLSLERWVAFVKSFIRLKHMQDLLIQRKGIIPPTTESSSTAPSSPNRHFASSSSIASDKMRSLYSQRSQSSNDLLLKDEGVASSSTLFPSLLDDLSSAMVPNPTDSNRLRTHSQPSDSSAAPSSSTRLAPLKLKRQKRQEAKANFLQKSGFDSGFGRETPRCLRPGDEGSVELSKDNAKWEMIRELKRELQLSQDGLAQIDHAMAENITWVHNNCPVDESLKGRTLSKRAVKHCQRISSERFLEIFDSIRLVALRRAFEKMKFAVKLTVIAILSKDYSRAKAIEILSHILSAALRRQYQRVFKPWLIRMKWERRWEQEAASVEIGRVIRGFLSRRKIYHQIRETNAVVLQCSVRVFLSKCRVHHRRMKKRIAHATRVLVRFFRGLVAVSKAKAIVQERREQRAALKIQSLQRGIVARRRVQAIRAHQLLVQRSAVVIQCLYRSKIRAFYRVQRRREELQQEQERLQSLHLAEQKRRASAVLCLQCFGRQIIARRLVARKRVERYRHAMATKIQRFVRRVLETQLYKKRLKEMKRARNDQRKREQQERRQQEMALAEDRSEPPVVVATPSSSRPSSSSSTSSVLHTAAVKLQSLYRGAVVRENVQTIREDKKKTAPRLFTRSTVDSAPPPQSQHAPSTPDKQSRTFLGFKSKSGAESEKPKTPSTPQTSSSFFGLMRSSSRDHHEDPPPHPQPHPQEQHSARSEEEKPSALETELEKPAEGPHPSTVHRMLSIVKSVSREDEESPLVSPSPRQHAAQGEEAEPQEVPVDDGNALAVEPQPQVEPEPEPPAEVDQEIQEINSSAAAASTPTQSHPTPTSGAKTPSRDTSVLTPLAAMGKKLFRTNSEMSPTTPKLSKSPSFFRSLSRPASRSSSDAPKEGEDQKKGLLSKSPLLRSLSQSIFGNRETNGTPLPEKDQSRLATPAEGPEAEAAAAMAIQRAARIRQAKKKTQERREKAREVQQQAGAWSLWAASSIQRIVRGKLARQRLKRIRREREVAPPPLPPPSSSPPP
jgi:hypothetical protein